MTDEDDDAQERTKINTRDKHWPNAAVYSSFLLLFSSAFLSLCLTLPPFVFSPCTLNDHRSAVSLYFHNFILIARVHCVFAEYFTLEMRRNIV